MEFNKTANIQTETQLRELIDLQKKFYLSKTGGRPAPFSEEYNHLFNMDEKGNVFVDEFTWIDKTISEFKESKNKDLNKLKLQKEQDEKKSAQTIPSPRYGEFRAMDYAPIPEQLDMIYWDKINGTSIHQDHVTEVKERYLKFNLE